MWDRSKTQHPECPCCTCGLTEVTWSDRRAHVRLDDAEDVVDIVLACALDHSYDTTGTGVPYGLPDEIRNRLGPIVVRHMAAVSPDWQRLTADVSDEQRAALRAELLRTMMSGQSKV